MFAVSFGASNEVILLLLGTDYAVEALLAKVPHGSLFWLFKSLPDLSSFCELVLQPWLSRIYFSL